MGSIEPVHIDPRPAVFLDRDGTLIEEVNFLSKVEDLRLFSETSSAIERLKNAGFLLIVVTNQSGIGRGFYTVDDMDAIHRAMSMQLDGMIDAFFHCPHLPDALCQCRKPSLGMIEEAEQIFNIDRAASWMIGDKALDIELGRRALMQTVLVSTGYGANVNAQHEANPDFFVENIGDAASVILADHARPKSSSNRSISSSPK